MEKYNFKVLYILVSNNDDYYYEEFYLSIYSLKKYNPNISVSLILDNETNDSLIAKRKNALQMVNEKIIVDFPSNMTAREKSRRLKTNFRNIIDGTILYIDTDTIICDDLDGINYLTDDFAMVYEGNDIVTNHYSYKHLKEKFAKLKLKYGINSEYFNSGVIYVKDNKKTRDFFYEWQKKYLNYMKKGVTLDQPTLNDVNFEFGGIIKRLEDCYNCQMDVGIKYLSSAKIMHYLGLNTYTNASQLFFSFSKFADKNIFEMIKKEGIIPESIKEMVIAPKLQINKGFVITQDSHLFIILMSNQVKLLRAIYWKFHSLYILNEKILSNILLFFKKVKLLIRKKDSHL